MQYGFLAIPDHDVPQAIEPIFQLVVTTYTSETNKTVSMWRGAPPHRMVRKNPTAWLDFLLTLMPVYPDEKPTKSCTAWLQEIPPHGSIPCPLSCPFTQVRTDQNRRKGAVFCLFRLPRGLT